MKLIKAPFNGGALAKRKGIEKAPVAIEKELPNFFLKESGILPVFDPEDIAVDNSDMEGSFLKIQKCAAGLDFPAIILGGDHSITYPAFRGLSGKYRNPGLLVFDAHLDCMQDFDPPTHEDFIRVLIEKRFLKSENLLMVGSRNFHQDEIAFVRANKIKLYDMKEIIHEGIVETAEAVMAASRRFDALYVSIDIDVLDPAFAPGTGYLEPGGLTTRELIYFIQRLKNLRNIMVWDVVEVNPDKDVNGMTVSAAAKLVVEMS